MPRSTAAIDAELVVLEARASTLAASSMSADGVSTSADMVAIQNRIDQLWRMKDRMSGASPMFVRGVIKGL